MHPRLRRSSRASLLHRLRIGEALDDRAVGPIVAVAVRGQMAQRVAHLREFGDALVEFGHVLHCDGLDLGARARAVVPERQQTADIVDEKTQTPRLPDEAQRVHLFHAVHAVARFRARLGREQVHALVVADHFRGDARGARRFANVHAALLPNCHRCIDATPSHDGKVQRSPAVPPMSAWPPLA
ncbi:hypothetical protein PT2222_40034 [Paraburkholderia tropica]